MPEKADFVLQEIASVVRCNAGCWSEEHRAAVDRESRMNDVAKNAGQDIMQSRE